MLPGARQFFCGDSGPRAIVGLGSCVDTGVAVDSPDTEVECTLRLLGDIYIFAQNIQNYNRPAHRFSPPDVIVGHLGTNDENDFRFFAAILFDAGATRSSVSLGDDLVGFWRSFHTIGLGRECYVDGRLVASPGEYSMRDVSPLPTIHVFGAEGQTPGSTNAPGANIFAAVTSLVIRKSGVDVMRLVPDPAGAPAFVDEVGRGRYRSVNSIPLVNCPLESVESYFQEV